MKVKSVPSVTHLRRAAGPGSSCVFRIRGGVIDTYEARDLPNPNTSEQQLSREFEPEILRLAKQVKPLKRSRPLSCCNLIAFNVQAPQYAAFPNDA